MSRDEFLELKVKNKASQPRTDRGPRASARSGSRSPTARLRAASRTPEAVVKVISFASSKSQVQSLVDYVTRNGEMELELKDGSMISDRDGVGGTKDVIDTWSLDFRDRKNARNAMHVAISTPAGTDPDALQRIARGFGRRAFGEGYDYGFVVHTDSGNPHAHFVVVGDGQSRPYLGWNKAEAQQFRDLMVEEAEKEGVILNATPRYARGQIEKGERLNVRKAREREGVSDVDQKAAREVIDGLANTRGENVSDRPWTSAISQRLAEERADYEGLAESFQKIGASLTGEDRVSAEAAASMVRRQAMALRQLATRRDHMVRLAKETGIHKWPNRDAASHELAERYRANRDERREEKQLAPATTKAVQAKLDAFTRQAGSVLSGRVEDGDKDAEQLRERLDITKSRERNRDIEK